MEPITVTGVFGSFTWIPPEEIQKKFGEISPEAADYIRDWAATVLQAAMTVFHYTLRTPEDMDWFEEQMRSLVHSTKIQLIKSVSTPSTLN